MASVIPVMSLAVTGTPVIISPLLRPTEIAILLATNYWWKCSDKQTYNDGTRQHYRSAGVVSFLNLLKIYRMVKQIIINIFTKQKL